MAGAHWSTMVMVLIVALFAYALSPLLSMVGSATAFVNLQCTAGTDCSSPSAGQQQPSTPKSPTHGPCSPELIAALGDSALYWCD